MLTQYIVVWDVIVEKAGDMLEALLNMFLCQSVVEATSAIIGLAG
jgi:hypothetical protein